MSGILTIQMLLVVSAFICTIVSALGKCPEWVAVLLLCVLAMLMVWPK